MFQTITFHCTKIVVTLIFNKKLHVKCCRYMPYTKGKFGDLLLGATLLSPYHISKVQNKVHWFFGSSRIMNL